METWMTKEELLEGFIHWQKLALKLNKEKMNLEDYIDELEMQINILINEV